MAIKVLIVEPDATVRSGFAEALASSGFEVIETRTFQEGRRVLRNQAPGLLITEIRLAGFNGLQLILTNPAPIPSIVVSSADPVLQTEARRMGATYLIKPVSQADLLVAIEQLLAPFSETVALGATRRWIRKAVSSEMKASVDNSPARVLDVSYGGLRMEVQRAAEKPLPRSFNLKLVTAAALDFPAEIVWTNRTGDRSWQCGVALSRMGRLEASAWRGLVDRIP
jgi:DNA-binding response OmpR family regulator